MGVTWEIVTIEYHRNPIKLELVRHVIPLVLFVCFLAAGLGYGWAKTAYGNFQSVNSQPISSITKPNENHSINHRSGESRNPAGAAFGRPFLSRIREHEN